MSFQAKNVSNLLVILLLNICLNVNCFALRYNNGNFQVKGLSRTASAFSHTTSSKLPTQVATSILNPNANTYARLSVYSHASGKAKTAKTLSSIAVELENEEPITTTATIVDDPLKIIIAGAPAAGKGTQCQFIKDNFKVMHLSTGDILRQAVADKTELGLRAKGYMEEGQLVPDDLIISVIIARLKQDDCVCNGWILDGFPRTKTQAQALSDADLTPDTFILLNVKEDILVERVTGRRIDPVTNQIYHMKFNPPPNAEVEGRLLQRSDDTEEKIKVRYQEFQQHVNEIGEFYHAQKVEVDGSKDASDIQKFISNHLENVKKEPQEELKESQEETKDSESVIVKNTWLSSKLKTAMGLIVLSATDKVMKAKFAQAQIAFPSSLVSMMGAFSLMTLMKRFFPKFTDDKVFMSMSYSVAVLKSWLPLFFIPPLVVLPLKLGLIRGMELQLLTLCVTGFFASLFSSGYLLQFLKSRSKSTGDYHVVKSSPSFVLPSPKIPLFMSLLSFALTFAAPSSSRMAMVSQKIFEGSSTVSGYLIGTKLPSIVRQFLHPVLAGAVYSIFSLFVFAKTHGVSLVPILSSYFGTGAGTGDFIASILGPTIISFGLQLYQYSDMLVKTASTVTIATAVGAWFGIVSSAILSRFLRLYPKETLYAPLTRCITSALALVGAKLTNADPSVAVFLCVITGILGATLGEASLKKAKIVDDEVVGLAVGISSHGIGASSLAYNPLKFASSILAMTLTGVWTIVMLSYKPFTRMIAKLAGGSI